MTIDEMKQRVRDVWDAMNRGETEEMLGLASERLVFTVTRTTPVSGVYNGRDAVRGHLQRFGGLVEPGARMNVRELIAEGDRVVCLSSGEMRARTGRDYNNDYAFEFEEGEIVRITEFLDTALVETSMFGKTIS